MHSRGAPVQRPQLRFRQGLGVTGNTEIMLRGIQTRIERRSATPIALSAGLGALASTEIMFGVL